MDVPNGNVDKAWRTLNRKLKEERYMEVGAALAGWLMGAAGQ